ncbi:unnamed protein product [Leptidea sinapis]|uniref:Uncharacterized protein n=1 Tax=Leptidea sinapis TaxID=189913 RepID=A0A5E4R809_9NEOP|nr:unnamed protein product [Leptidea sinapis]
MTPCPCRDVGLGAVGQLAGRSSIQKNVRSFGSKCREMQNMRGSKYINGRLHPAYFFSITAALPTSSLRICAISSQKAKWQTGYQDLKPRTMVVVRDSIFLLFCGSWEESPMFILGLTGAAELPTLLRERES